MYTPAHFEEDRPEVLADAMREFQFACLVTAGEQSLQGTHLPMVVKEDSDGLVLEGHVARPNPHWKLSNSALPTMAIFQGPQAYVHPGWYPSKKEHQKVVPTWNYIVVHAHGHLEAIEDEAWLLGHLERLTRQNEWSRPESWAITDAPEKFIKNLTCAIVGLRMKVDRLEGIWKLSQNKKEGDRQGSLNGLSSEENPNSQAIASAMRRYQDA